MRNVPLFDSAARSDPFIGRVDDRGDFVIGQHSGWNTFSPACDCSICSHNYCCPESEGPEIEA